MTYSQKEYEEYLNQQEENGRIREENYGLKYFPVFFKKEEKDMRFLLEHGQGD